MLIKECGICNIWLICLNINRRFIITTTMIMHMHMHMTIK